MSMTVIFSNAGDEDCQTLRNLWKDVEDVKVVELTSSKKGMKDKIRQAISEEEDFLIMCGHGCNLGLFNAYWRDGLAFSSADIPLVKAKNVLCIWCYAGDFCKENNFRVLTSSMYISNSIEANYNNLPGYTQEYVNDTNNHTFQEMNKYIREGVPTKDWPKLLMDTLDKDNKIDEFNRKGMMYLGD